MNEQQNGYKAGSAVEEVPRTATRPRGGAPARNQNRTLHAMFGIGLPTGATKIAGRLNRFRRELTRLVEERHGEVSLYHAAVIDACLKWERLAQLAGRWLRKEGEKLSPQEKLSFAKEIAKAAVERNRAMAALDIDVQPDNDPWAALDRLRAREALDAQLARDSATQAIVGDSVASADSDRAAGLSPDTGTPTPPPEK